jgi:hypothetical protein
MPIRDESSYDELENRLLGGEGSTIRLLDQYLRRREPVNTITVLIVNSSRLINIGPALTYTDRELRRAVSILGSEPDEDEASYNFGRPGFRPRPIRPSAGGLLVDDASAGSLNLIVEAYGAVLSLLQSQPVAALCTIFTLSQIPASIRTWIDRPRREDEGLFNSRQVLDLLRESRGNTARVLPEDTPDHELDVVPTQYEAQLGESEEWDTDDQEPDIPMAPDISYPPTPDEEVPTIGTGQAPRESVYRTNEFEVRGREIIHIRISADGTQDIINVKS